MTLARITTLFLLGVALILPQSVSAQVDNRCFTRESCTKARQAMDQSLDISAAEEGFVASSDSTEALDACGARAAGANAQDDSNELGFCLPIGQAQTQISFGGTNRFTDAGQFIKYLYQYGVAVASIVAVIMIIISGLQWMTAAGNSDQVGSARKRIGNAIVGLFLAVMSYFILNLINPYLVNLRLPQTWLINTQGLAPAYCRDAATSTQFALANISTNASKTEKDAAFGTITTFPLNANQTTCGEEYFTKDGGGQACTGTICSNNTTCYLDPLNNAYSCKPGNIVGTIHTSNIFSDTVVGATFFEVWTDPWANEPLIHAVCSDGSYPEIASGNTRNFDDPKVVQYRVSVTENDFDQAVDDCTLVRGYVLSLDMNEGGLDGIDERHWIGKGGQDLGDEEAFTQVARNANSNIFFSQEDLRAGIALDINAGNIADIDNEFGNGDEALRRRLYGQYGYR